MSTWIFFGIGVFGLFLVLWTIKKIEGFPLFGVLLVGISIIHFRSFVFSKIGLFILISIISIGILFLLITMSINYFTNYFTERKRKYCNHKFEPIAGKCMEECSICGKKIDIAHKFDPNYNVRGYNCEQRCITCRETIRHDSHEFEHIEGKCIEKCSFCGKEINVKHKFELIADKCIKKCIICGYEEESYTNHKYETIKIERVSDLKDYGDWEEGIVGEIITKKCSICGRERIFNETYHYSDR